MEEKFDTIQLMEKSLAEFPLCKLANLATSKTVSSLRLLKNRHLYKSNFSNCRKIGRYFHLKEILIQFGYKYIYLQRASSAKICILGILYLLAAISNSLACKLAFCILSVYKNLNISLKACGLISVMCNELFSFSEKC